MVNSRSGTSLVLSLRLTEASKRPNIIRSSHRDGQNNNRSCSSDKYISNKADSDGKDWTDVAFAQTAGDTELPATQNAAQLLMVVGYNTHGDGDLYGTLHFFQTAVWQADSDADSEDDESTDSDPDEPYQLHIVVPDGDIDGNLDKMIDIIERVDDIHLTWKVETQATTGKAQAVDNQSTSTASSFHKNIGNDDANSIDRKYAAMSPLVLYTSYPNLDYEAENTNNTVVANTYEDCSYYGSVADTSIPEVDASINAEDAADDIDHDNADDTNACLTMTTTMTTHIPLAVL